jgi:hypothetical protein
MKHRFERVDGTRCIALRQPKGLRASCGLVGERLLARHVASALRPDASRHVSTSVLFAAFLGAQPWISLQALDHGTVVGRRDSSGTHADARGLALVGARGGSGSAVAHAGDVNGDGIADAIIGAPDADIGGEPDVGEAYVVFGRTTAFPDELELARLFVQGGGDGSEGFVLKGIEAEDHTGLAVAGAGDINGDGLDDVVIGAPISSIGPGASGRAFVVFGRTTVFPAEIELRTLLPEYGGDGSAGFVLNGFRYLSQDGRSVAGAGDINGDGLDDLVLCNYFSRRAPSECYVVFGRSTDFPPTFELSSLITGGGRDGFVLTGTDASDNTGSAVSTAGDLDADGLADLIVGAPNAGQEFHCQSYVVFGRATGYPPVFPLLRLFPPFGTGSEGFVLDGLGAHGHTGADSANAGDINGDGVGDIVVTDPFARPGGDERAGATYVVFGRSSGFPAFMSLGSLLPAGDGDGSGGFVLTGVDERDYSGGSARAAGDLNGDGFADLVLSAFGADPRGRTTAGKAYVVLGRPSFPPVVSLSRLFPAHGGDGTEGSVIIGADANDRTGTSVDGAGDLDADGIDDLLVGAPGAAEARGKTYVVFGSATGFPALVDVQRLGSL